MEDEAFNREKEWPPDLGTWWRDLQIAAAFLTRLPIRVSDPAAPPALARAVRCFPLVGLGVGLVGAVVHAIAIGLALPPLLAAVLAVAAVVLVTGALHEDGLADTADGFGGGRHRDDKLRIMRDSRIGTYGVIALVLSLGTQIAALSTMPGSRDVAAALVICHAVSRALLVPVMQHEPPARADGLAVSVGRPTTSTTLWALGLGGLIALVFGWFVGLVAAAIGTGIAWLLARFSRRQIGGITGDVLGAIQQLTVIAMLLALVALD